MLISTGAKCAFSPLFVGAMVATEIRVVGFEPRRLLSVPFSSGQWLLLKFGLSDSTASIAFSPLFVGAMVATVQTYFSGTPDGDTFSPLFVGAMVATN